MERDLSKASSALINCSLIFGAIREYFLWCLNYFLFHIFVFRQYKVIQDSLGFQIPRCPFWILVSGAWIRDFGFLELNSGFQSPGFRTPNEKVSGIPEFVLPFKMRCLVFGYLILFLPISSSSIFKHIALTAFLKTPQPDICQPLVVSRKWVHKGDINLSGAIPWSDTN